MTVFLNCKELFVSEEDLDINTYDTFKNKGIVVGSSDFTGEITEFRLRKEKIQVS